MSNIQYQISNLRAEAQSLLESNILPFWSTRMVDNERGGFYGRIDGHNTLHPDAEKGAVLNARILWTFSAAARMFHKMPYRMMAARAKDYLVNRFIDREYGGVYWSLNADGTPLDTKKQTYAIAFAIYGLTEYYRATQDSEALLTAIRLFEDIEAHAYKSYMINDKMVNGYMEALARNWQSIADMRLSEKDENGVFTMNTHLHVLEAYTNLYRVLADVQGDDVQSTKVKVVQQLRALIEIFATRIYNPSTGHLGLFFDENWHPSNTHVSPGHDIEAAWLLREAQAVLDENKKMQKCENEKINNTSRRLAIAAWNGILREEEWWCYAEAVVGYLDQYQDNPDPHYLNLVMAAWDEIQNRFIDRAYGEWFWSVLPDGTLDRTHDKAGFWKCPYHNSRMCFELIERLK